MNAPEISTPYQQGYQAYMTGKSRDVNPYWVIQPDGWQNWTPNVGEWDAGWIDARNEAYALESE